MKRGKRYTLEWETRGRLVTARTYITDKERAEAHTLGWVAEVKAQKGRRYEVAVAPRFIRIGLIQVVRRRKGARALGIPKGLRDEQITIREGWS